MNKLKLSHPEELSNKEKIQNALQQREENVGASVVSIALAQLKRTWYLQDEAAGAQVAAGLEGLGAERQRTKASLTQMRDIIRNSQVPGLLSTEQKQKDLEKWEKIGPRGRKVARQSGRGTHPAQGESGPSEAAILRTIRTAHPHIEFMVVKSQDERASLRCFRRTGRHEGAGAECTVLPSGRLKPEQEGHGLSKRSGSVE
ncbi:hypothetical protein LTS15_001973 [Exophiala xenobiotica]|nr:hypothetical protein LTS15_001973 [Exophiala xenobiotica]